MTRIVHLVSSLQTGGAEKFVFNLARQQQAMGEDVTVISFGAADEHFQVLLEHASVPVINVSGALLGRLAKLLTLRIFDVIHIHSPAVIRALTPLAALLAAGHVIYTIHGEVDPPQSALKLAHRIALGYLNAVTAVSDAARESVVKRYGWSVDRVQVIGNGVWMPELNSDNSTGAHGAFAPICLGTVSRLIPLKNIGLLFDALTRLPDAQRARFKVVVFGDGPCREDLEQAGAAVEGCPIEFAGNETDEGRIFHSIDILVNCSDTEGLPMSIIEAMSYGKAVIATRVGAVPEVVEDGSTGWLYAPRDAEALAEILSHIATVNAADSWQSAGQRAREWVASRFSIAGVAEQFQALYAAITSPRSARS